MADTSLKISNRLSMRFPRRNFVVIENDNRIDITFDVLTMPAEEKKIEGFVTKLMSLEYPNNQYSLERMVF